MKTQKGIILNYLMNYKRGITSKEAFEKFGITRLSAIINELRTKDKYPIDSFNEEVETRWGRNTIVSRYKMNEAYRRS